MTKIATILGTRPEAIKLAPVILALRSHPTLRCRVCATAQHRDLLDPVLDTFGIRPDADLDLIRPDQTLAGLTGRAVEGIDRYLEEESPDLVLIQGDTTTVLSAALAAFYRKIPIGHVEAGLRTGDLRAPWPEEANRVLTTTLTSLHFAPTDSNRENLLREGVRADRIFVTGNTVIDALHLAVDRLKSGLPTIPDLPDVGLDDEDDPPLVLITGHRRESFGEGMESICRAIGDLARRFPETRFVYPVHLNPNVREPVHRILGGGDLKRNVHLLRPLPYLAFVALMRRASLILTDSGGIQEEAPGLGKPVLLMREVTERPEAVQAGTVRLVGTDAAGIVGETARLLEDDAEREAMSRAHNPYGDGKAAGRIVEACERFFEDRTGGP